MGNSKLLGQWGEDVTLQYLQQKGYSLVARNYRSPYGEIDLIVRDRFFLVFVEVKLRKSARFAAAMEFVDDRKQEKIRTTALYWLQDHPTDMQPRFDVVELYAPYGTDTQYPNIYHWEEAFQ